MTASAQYRAPTVFDWRRNPSSIDWRGKTERQTLLDATRVNAEATLGFSPQPKPVRKRAK